MQYKYRIYIAYGLKYTLPFLLLRHIDHVYCETETVQLRESTVNNTTTTAQNIKTIINLVVVPLTTIYLIINMKFEIDYKNII